MRWRHPEAAPGRACLRQPMVSGDTMFAIGGPQPQAIDPGTITPLGSFNRSGP